MSVTDNNEVGGPDLPTPLLIRCAKNRSAPLLVR
jgi:hypothetical protein